MQVKPAARFPHTHMKMLGCDIPIFAKGLFWAGFEYSVWYFEICN